MSVSAAPLSAGAITVTIAVEPTSAHGATRARAIEIASTRPTGVTSGLFVGRPIGDVPPMVARMHALCGRSHMVASEVAIVAALGRDVEAVVSERFDTLLAERLGELLRTTVMGSGPARADLADREVLADVRAVLASVRTLEGGGRPAAGFEAAGTRERIREGLGRLGLGIDRRGRFRARAGSWAQTMLERFGPRCGDVHLPCDRLDRHDDAAVLEALVGDPAGFVARPRLAGRRPETGPAARAASGPGTADGLARMTARLGEIVEAAELLDAPAADRARIAGDWVTGGRLDTGIGWAAVESPRGRLHHLVRLDGEGRVAAHAILAPTEWNFHPEGPLVATLSANRWGWEAADLERAARIAGLFDPCVAFDVRIVEASDA